MESRELGLRSRGASWGESEATLGSNVTPFDFTTFYEGLGATTTEGRWVPARVQLPGDPYRGARHRVDPRLVAGRIPGSRPRQSGRFPPERLLRAVQQPISAIVSKAEGYFGSAAHCLSPSCCRILASLAQTQAGSALRRLYARPRGQGSSRRRAAPSTPRRRPQTRPPRPKLVPPRRT